MEFIGKEELIVLAKDLKESGYDEYLKNLLWNFKLIKSSCKFYCHF